MDATDGTSDNPVPPREVWAGMGFGVEGTNPFITRAPSGPPTHTGSATNAVGPQPPAPSRNGVRLVNADAPAGAIPAAGLLTDEELAMLLHDEPLPEKTQTPGEANG
jgi:hypothetical protein